MEYMQRAIELASLAQGRTSPNPLVGAVIVKDGKIIGEGYHKKAGTPHAEIHALTAAGSASRGATLYVSLEPCCHHGRTPPCTEAIIEAGIKRVVIATLDPNPKVAGGGLQKLQEAGIDAEFGLLQQAARELNEVFFKYIQKGLPFVALKTAMTLDGKIAASSGDSRWITGPEARQYVHHLRNTYDAIMVGIGTVLADNPQLNTRLNEGNGRDPLRIIIDNQLKLPLGSIIACSSREQPSLVFCGTDIDEHKAAELTHLGVEIIKIELEHGLVPLHQVLTILAQREISSILVEGGAEINASLVEQGLVDKFYWFIGPKIIGGRKALSPVGGTGFELMREAMDLTIQDIKQLGRDILITAVSSN
ncbi:MAG: bifunctional diaminohydroxyphosphoribosylaminopyrimidine deaminase/5-amino-6-(5-phosphoribosylamino)uracil reductase RibD [Syntrophomonadaceae bacterium]|nr:bifunctional diaminohydroxyphosphoribosylaminopyrimidine deaminase/5-amino-6-(5-phosphoribosylamino)uracil reductase RibD [Syntrophomonadaceae bacterium]